MNKLYATAKIFLENFSLDYDWLTKELEKIMKRDFSLLGINKKMTISFDENKLFGRGGSVSKTNISFNKTRIETLLALKIDDTDAEHLKKIESFYSNYNEKTKHSIFEENLYNFIKKYKELGAEWAFEHMGSYKTIKYEMLDTILHECEHVYQDEFKNCLNTKNYPNDTRSKILIFTSLFNTMFEKLQKGGVNLNYKRENHIFPIEFDARYEALRQLSEIKNLYFKDDKDFANHLIKSNIIPKDFNAEETSKRIFDDYERIYKLYKQHFGNEYESANNFLLKSKNKIIDEFVRRYEEMQNISINENTKSHLSFEFV